MRAEVVRELESVRVKITAAGNQVLDAGGSDHHADKMVACALAYYQSDLMRGFVGEGRLEGWYSSKHPPSGVTDLNVPFWD